MSQANLNVRSAAIVLVTAALAASYVPIRRVLAQNPLASLRETA
jgi:hypothetical protein